MFFFGRLKVPLSIWFHISAQVGELVFLGKNCAGREVFTADDMDGADMS